MAATENDPGNASILLEDNDLKSRLLSRLEWLWTMRWIAAATALAVVAYTTGVLKMPLPAGPLFALPVILAVTNLVYGEIHQRIDTINATQSSIERLVYIQVFTDLVILSFLIHFAGGMMNLFVFFFAFHIVIASILVPTRASYGVAVLGSVLVSGMAMAEHSDVLRHYSLGPYFPNPPYHDFDYLIHFLLAFNGLLFTIAYIASTLGTMILRREIYLSALKDDLEIKNEALRAANERLQEIDRTKTSFMRMASHEIRAPLNAVMGILRIIVEGYVEDKGKMIDMIGSAYNRGNDALDYTSDLIRLAREKSKDVFPESVDLAAEINAILTRLDPPAIGANVELIRDIPVQPRLTLDRESFILAAENIIDNALKYSLHGGRVTVSLEESKDHVLLTVEDIGIGIPESEAGDLFSEFHRAPNARSHASHGTGLGLAIAQRAALNISAEITIESAEGKGTAAYLRIPK